MTDRELLVRIEERLNALQNRVEVGFKQIREEICDLQDRQRVLNGAQKAANVRDDEFQSFIHEMRNFKDDLLEWKGEMKKQAGIVGAAAGLLPALAALIFMLLSRGKLF